MLKGETLEYHVMSLQALLPIRHESWEVAFALRDAAHLFRRRSPHFSVLSQRPWRELCGDESLAIVGLM